MDKLILPAGCTFEGEITAIANTGDILITAALTPARIHSEQGSITFKTSAAKATCEEITAPQGRVELEGESLAVAKLVAAEALIKANECELEELSLTGHLAIDTHDIVVGTLNAASATLSGDTVKGDLIEVEGDLHLEANLTMVREIHAGKVVIHGSIDCKTLVAREGVVVATGNVAIKRLDAPSFEAAPEVTGIVVLATCKAVKAQGVRGFLHPNELDMLNDAAMAGGAVASLQARTRLTAAPPEVRTVPVPVTPAPPPEPEPVAAAEFDAFERPQAVAEEPTDLVMDSGFEDDAFDAERAFAEAEAEFDAAPTPDLGDGGAEELEEELEDYETVLLPEAPAEAEPEVVESEPEPAAEPEEAPAEPEAFAPDDEDVTALADEDIEEINTGELMDHFDDMAELEDEAEEPPFSVEDVAAEPASEAAAVIDTFNEEPHFDAFTEVYDTRDVAEPKLPNWGARRGNSGEFDTVALDPESLRNLSASFEAMPAVEDLPEPDFGVPDELEAPEALSVSDDISDEVVEAQEDAAAAAEAVSADFLPGDLDDEAFEVVAAEESDFDDQVIEVPEELSPDELDELSGTFDPDELEAISDSDFDGNFDDEVEDLDDELSAEELDDTPVQDPEFAAGEVLEAASAYELDDVALPEIGELDAYDFPGEEDDVDDDPLGEAVQEAFDELEHSIEPALDFSPEPEPQLNPEDALIHDLFALLDQLSSYFEEEYQPINQIHRYLEERRLNLFYKEGNRNAVLGSFDKHNNAQVSQLVRGFFARLDQYREQYG